MHQLTKPICKIVGHKWRYKNYSNWIKENGDNYDFTASRNCARCDQNQYLNSEWKTADRKSPYDLERDVHAVKQLPGL